MEMPAVVYRYMKYDDPVRQGWVKDVLSQNRIWASSARDFNDPFDTRLEIAVLNEQRAVESCIRSQLIQLLEQNGVQLTSDMRGALKVAVGAKELAEFRGRINSIIQEQLYEWGIVCFTEVNDSDLMWSHYADNHKGICLMFKTAIKGEVLLGMREVEYVDAIPRLEIRLTDRCTFDNKDELVRNVSRCSVYTKKAEWKYEREWRARTGGPGYCEIPPEAVLGIIIGAEVPSPARMDIALSARTRGVEVFQANRAPDTGAVRIERVIVNY